MNYTTPVKVENVTENDIQLRDDVIFIMLYPLIDKELEKQYGEAPQIECEKLSKLKGCP